VRDFCCGVASVLETKAKSPSPSSRITERKQARSTKLPSHRRTTVETDGIIQTATTPFGAIHTWGPKHSLHN
jgi:hypothetical protein